MQQTIVTLKKQETGKKKIHKGKKRRGTDKT